MERLLWTFLEDSREPEIEATMIMDAPHRDVMLPVLECR